MHFSYPTFLFKIEDYRLLDCPLFKRVWFLIWVLSASYLSSWILSWPFCYFDLIELAVYWLAFIQRKTSIRNYPIRKVWRTDVPPKNWRMPNSICGWCSISLIIGEIICFRIRTTCLLIVWENIVGGISQAAQRLNLKFPLIAAESTRLETDIMSYNEVFIINF